MENNTMRVLCTIIRLRKRVQCIDIKLHSTHIVARKIPDIELCWSWSRHLGLFRAQHPLFTGYTPLVYASGCIYIYIQPDWLFREDYLVIRIWNYSNRRTVVHSTAVRELYPLLHSPSLSFLHSPSLSSLSSPTLHITAIWHWAVYGRPSTSPMMLRGGSLVGSHCISFSSLAYK